jgi:hypothetical protein
MAEQPNLEPTPVVEADLARIRTELDEAGIAARRTLARLRVARLVTAAMVQVVVAFVLWRIWVWRARRRR